jgi:hypothetical protein
MFLPCKSGTIFHHYKVSKRYVYNDVPEASNKAPTVAPLGPRQFGKNTLAEGSRELDARSLYLDLECAFGVQSSFDPAGTSTVTITSSGGGQTQTAKLTFTVQ